jgi:ribosomal protein L31
MKPARTKKVCTFHLQGRCKFGMRGQKEEDGKLKMCPFFHPKVCDKFLEFGNAMQFGCNTGCKRLHPKMCQNVIKCDKKCGNYHMTNTVIKSDTVSPRRITQEHCLKIPSYIDTVSNVC